MELVNTDKFPEDVYDALPELLKECCSFYETPRDRDVFLISAITIISGCLPRLKGIYDRDYFSPNINTFIIAPPASGKKCMKDAKSLGTQVHEMLREMPQSGRFPAGLFIPGDTSPRAIVEHLNSNIENNGIICETEADAIGSVMKQEWGDYSPILRNAFSHETISLSRVKEYDHIELDSPKLSVLISGTPNQFGNIITDIENGLFSRFFYYLFATPGVWKDVTPKDEETIMSKLKPYSEKVKLLNQKYQEQECLYVQTNEQWVMHHNFFNELYNEIIGMYGENAHSAIVRTGILCFRVGMVLTAIRNINEPYAQTLTCTNDDFAIAQKIAGCLIDHAMLLFTNSEYPPIEYVMGIELLKQELPLTEFQRKDAIAIGHSFDMSTRVVDKYISILKEEGFLTPTKYGHYIRSDVQSMQSEQPSESPSS